MDDAGAVGTEFQFAGLEFLDRGLEVRGDGAGLGVGHQATGAENPTQLGHLGHHVGGGNQQVEIHFALADAFHQVFFTGEFGTGGFGFSHLLTAGHHGDAHGLTGAVGQSHGGAQLLVGVLRIDAEAHMGLHRLVEFRVGVVLHQGNRLEGCVSTVLDLAGQAGQTLGDFGHVQSWGSDDIRDASPVWVGEAMQRRQSLMETPMLRAVPSMIRMADSTLVQLRSGSLVLAISSS